MSVAALVGLTVTGCAGPSAPLDVGTQTAPLALVLGQLKAVDQAPIGPLPAPTMPWTRPYYEAPDLGVIPPTLPPLPVGPCPDFDPLSPVLGVGRAIPAPPPKATYTYRASLQEMIALKPTLTEGNSQWTVEPGPADPTTGAYDVTYTIKLGASVTKRVLRTLPRDIGGAEGDEFSDQTNPNTNTAITTANAILPALGLPPLPTSMPNLAGYGLAGVYLVKQETTNGTTHNSFEPQPPVALLQLRQISGATDKAGQNASAITSVGVDPTTQAVMAFRSVVSNSSHKINACGTKLESVEVSLMSPNSPDFTPPAVPVVPFQPNWGAATYVEKDPASDPAHPKANVLLFGEKLDFGLQYGGLLLHDLFSVAFNVPPNGVQVDPQAPAPTPSAQPKDPADPMSWAAWVSEPTLAYAMQHGISKTSEFTINEKPKLLKTP